MELERSPWGHDDYVRYFEAFLLAHPELPATRFGTLAAADHAFIWRLRKGVNFSIDKLNRAVAFVENYDSKSCSPGVELLKKGRGRPTLRRGPRATT